MATTNRRWGKWLLWLLVLVSLAVIGGWKWMEHLSLKEEERTRLFAQEQKEKRERALKLATAEKNAAENKKEAERLQAERDLLAERARECKKPIVAARKVAKAKKKVAATVKPKPKPAEASPKTIVSAPAPAPEKKEEPKPVVVSAPAPLPKQEEQVAQREKKEEKVEKKETPPALQAPPQASGYQFGGACTLSDGTPGMVTATFRNGNVQCSEVVLVSVPNKAKAAAQYIVCTTAGAAVGYYNGGTYSAISGGVGGAGGTYLGRKLGGEDWGWVGCVTGPVAGFIRYGGAEKTARPIAGGPVNPTAGGGPVNPTP